MKDEYTSSEEFYRDYEKEHCHCPICGQKGVQTSLVGYIADLKRPNEYKDKNRIICHNCGYKGIYHDLVGEGDVVEKVVTYRVAEVLRSLGFNKSKDHNCKFVYLSPSIITKVGYHIDRNMVYEAPTLDAAMDWLRETHKIHIEIPASLEGENAQSRRELKYSYAIVINNGDTTITRVQGNEYYDTYEEAVNEGIFMATQYI